jgi:hypothetical protein
MGASARGMEVNCGPKKRLPRWPRPCVRGWSTGPPFPPSDSPVGYALSATFPSTSLSSPKIDPAYCTCTCSVPPASGVRTRVGSTRRFHPLAGGVAMQSEDENPQLRIVIPAAACPENPLASPLPMAPPGSTSKMPTSTTKGLGSFSLNRAKRGELTALDPLNPPKKSRSPDGFAAPWAAGASDGAPSPATGPALARTHLQNGQ